MLRKSCMVALVAALALPAARARAAEFFPKGSLIIPTQANYQSPCGMVSSYGLVYSLLRANDDLSKGKVNSDLCPGKICGRITVHWVYLPTKSSPNRCVPTNLDTPPPYPGVPSPVWNDPRWNDGCDFRVELGSGTPVKLINNADGNNIDADSTLVTKSTIAGDPDPDAPNQYADWPTGGGGPLQIPLLAYPQYGAETIDKTVTSIGYLGGAFVISAADAPVVLGLLSGNIIANDVEGQPIDYSQFVVQPADTGVYCNVDPASSTFFFDTQHGTPPGVPGMVDDGAAAYGNEHHVNIHRANISFTASDSARINTTPARIALLQYAGGVSSRVSGKGNGVVGDMLPKYLASAGLNFTGAAGCPTGSVNASNTDICPAAKPDANGNSRQHGQIYDAFDVLDLAADNDALNNPLSPGDKYPVAWVPHWEGTPFAAGGGLAACPADDTCIKKAMRNLVTYTDRDNGLLAECASIGVIEGTPVAPDYSNLFNFSYTADTSAPGSALLTCVSSNPATGLCDDPVVNSTAGLQHDEDIPYGSILQNCTDPNVFKGEQCIHHASPGNPFAQIGDYLWASRPGLVSEYFPNTGNVYRPGANPLSFTIGNVDPAKLDTQANARAQASADNVTFIQKSNSKGKARIVYIGGHTYSTDIAGTRVVLDSILALGFIPSTNESAYIGPTGYTVVGSDGLKKGRALVPTYDRVDESSTPPPSWRTYSPNTGSQWVFPFFTGHLRAVDVSALAQGTTSFDTLPAAYNTIAASDAAQVLTNSLPPKSRNLFTYLGGYVTSPVALGVGKTAANGVLQIGWKPVDIDSDSLGNGCMDDLKLGQICGTSLTNPCAAGTTPTKLTYQGAPYAGMVAGQGGNGVCDLQESLALTIQPADLGATHGGTALQQAAIIAKLKTAGAVRDAQELLAMVRGYCYSTDSHLDGNGNLNAHPASDADCNANFGSRSADFIHNQSKLGGLVKSKAVVVGPSVLVPDQPTGKVRPTVAYVGGLDGQLHAFYIPSSPDGSDVSGYTGPLQSSTTLTSSATGVFHSTWGGGAGFAPPVALTELWSFIPPGQLPFLQSNDAKVDSSPSVIDVFGDFDGSGKRTWHTVLVSSAGGTNRELFALDVTNPIAPILLWDIESSFDANSLNYAPTPLTDDDTGLSSVGADALSAALRWANACQPNDTSCSPAKFVLPPATDDTGVAGDGARHGLRFDGLYNYTRLGASQSVGVALLRRNNVPIYAAFVATNQPGGNGMSVFALDLVTGQKIWEFDNPYVPPFGGVIDGSGNWPSGETDRQAGAGNTPPAGALPVSRVRNGLVDLVYTGDDMGRLWELDAQTGVNMTAYGSALGCSVAGSCNYAFSDAYGADALGAQPISTIPTVFVMPDGVVGNLSRFSGQAMLTYGTAGTDTVSALVHNPPISGAVHLMSIEPTSTARYLPVDLPTDVLRGIVATDGVAREHHTDTDPGSGPFLLQDGNRLFGGILALGSQLVFGTTVGSVTDPYKRPFNSDVPLGGATFTINLSSTTLQPNASIDEKTFAIITGSGAVGGAPIIVYTNASGGTTLDPNAGGTVTGYKLIESTDRQVVTVGFTGAPPKMVDTGGITGKQGGTNGTAGFFGWFWRKLGREN